MLPYLSTGNVARDLDVLRAAVGDERLTYLGYSYGTAIGMTYVSLFPDRQRAVVLDSPVDTRYFDDPLSFWHDSTAAREVALGRFLERCRRQQARCGFGGAHPRRALDALLARLERTPIAVAGGLPINGDIARGAIGDLLDPRDWMQLADSLSLARHGDGRLLEFGDLDTGLSADATFDEAGFVIKALDGDWPTSIGLYRRDGRRAFRDLPHFYVDSGFVQLPFAFLKLEPNGRFGGPFRTPDDAPTTLVVSATFDPQTPYASAQALTATLGNARLLTLRTSVATRASTTRSPPTSSICNCPSRARSAPRLWRPSPTRAQAAPGRDGCTPSPSAPSGTPTSAGTSSRRSAGDGRAPSSSTAPGPTHELTGSCGATRTSRERPSISIRRRSAAARASGSCAAAARAAGRPTWRTCPAPSSATSTRS
ncbi:MAG: alpha/beta fold hydrolase [Actinobacteria bacterium]|nr:MAG: alpha/beta fold hydrolase [Actinomycetota bacterium]